ncbi:hypothetical protein [Pseudomonas sp. NBRC 111123]|uniref:hypothetical protein n=1 Tax=Pseudomonas sp. NBRC 111123 TaxID=1661038 RepID=UPI000761717A|nr:hypothetical protein [Pseudomonas sp. NBRC 111123]
MSLNLDFVYYRNFTFDGHFHVRCSGDDLHKVKSIHYLLERIGAEGVVHLDGITVASQVTSGKVANHGCPATLNCEAVAGSYRIRPQITLVDSEILKLNLGADADATLRPEPLAIDIGQGEPTRRILDSVPLPSAATRRKRSVQAAPAFAHRPQGQRYPALIVVFGEGGYAQLMADLEPDATSILARYWPGLRELLDVQPFLDQQEREDERFHVLANHYWIEQPHSMLNDTFVALIQTLEALDYVEATAFVPPQVEPGNVLLGAAGVIATLLTGAAYVAGTNAFEQAQPYPGL